MKQPDPKLHFWISLVKSVFRIAAGYGLITTNYSLAGCLLITAETLGILEELV